MSRYSAPTLKPIGEDAKGEANLPKSPVMLPLTTVSCVLRRMRASRSKKPIIAGVIEPSAPNRLSGTQPLVVSVQTAAPAGVR